MWVIYLFQPPDVKQLRVSVDKVKTLFGLHNILLHGIDIFLPYHELQ